MTSPFAYAAPSAAVERTYLRQVFAWMLLGLALTTGVAIYLDATANVLDYFEAHTGVFWLLFFAQLGLVIGLSRVIGRISAQTAALLFCLYAGLTGVVFALLLQVYTTARWSARSPARPACSPAWPPTATRPTRTCPAGARRSSAR
jgi:FtsH-binding integral membrane protein